MKIPEELLPVVEWWEKDGKKTLAYAAVIGVAALAWWSWTAHKARVRDEAAAALVGNSGSVDELQASVAKYGDTESGPALKMKLAAAYLDRGEEGDAEEALGIYDDLIASGNIPGAFASVPATGRAEALEALGKYEEAAEAYKAAAEMPGNLVLAAKLGQGRCMAQSGNKDDAIAFLEGLKDGASDADKTRIEATIDVAKRWVKRDAAYFDAIETEEPAAPAAEEPAAPAVEEPAAPAVEEPAAPAAEEPAAPETEAPQAEAPAQPAA